MKTLLINIGNDKQITDIINKNLIVKIESININDWSNKKINPKKYGIIYFLVDYSKQEDSLTAYKVLKDIRSIDRDMVIISIIYNAKDKKNILELDSSAIATFKNYDEERIVDIIVTVNSCINVKNFISIDLSDIVETIKLGKNLKACSGATYYEHKGTDAAIIAINKYDFHNTKGLIILIEAAYSINLSEVSQIIETIRSRMNHDISIIFGCGLLTDSEYSILVRLISCD